MSGLGAEGPQTPSIISSIAAEPPSVTILKRFDVSIPSAAIMLRKAALTSWVPALGVYFTIPSENLEFPSSFIRFCMAGCMGRDTLPIARFTTWIESISIL